MSPFPGGASMSTSPSRAWLSASVLSPSVAAYVAYLQRHRYSTPIAGAYLHAVGHFAHWLTEEHLPVRHLDESVVRRFLTTHLPNCRCPGRCQRTIVVVQAGSLGTILFWDLVWCVQRFSTCLFTLSLSKGEYWRLVLRQAQHE